MLADYLTVKGDAFCCENQGEGLTAHGAGPLGAVCLGGASITGQVLLRYARLDTADPDTLPQDPDYRDGPALMADFATIQGGTFLDLGFAATGQGSLGAIRLPEAKINAVLCLRGAELVNQAGPALVADGITVQGDVLMTGDPHPGRAFSASGAGQRGTILFRGASISGRLSLERATVSNAAGGAPVGADRQDGGAVCLTGATVGGDLVLRRATLTNYEPASALLADYLTVKGDAFCCENQGEGLTAHGAGPLGAVCLGGASITGQMLLRYARLDTADPDTLPQDPDYRDGPALMADFATIQGSTFLGHSFIPLEHGGVTGSFIAKGGDSHGTVTFVDASLSKELYCWGRADNLENGPALNLTRTTVGTLSLYSGFASTGTLQLDGLTYKGLPRVVTVAVNNQPVDKTPEQSADQWLSWFRGPVKYTGQPYEALAAAYGNVGNDVLARRILVAQRDAVRDRGELSPVRKVGQYLSKALIGYGYHCFYAFIWLALLFAVTILIAVFWFGPDRYIVPTTTASQVASNTTAGKASAESQCTVTGRISYAIDLAFPIINLNSSSEQQCDVKAPGSPGVVLFGWIVRALAATLFVLYGLGITGVTRSPPSATGS